MTTPAEINQIKIAAELSKIAQKGGTPPAGWREYSNDDIDKTVNTGSGYQAKVFVNEFSKEIYIANAGTNDYKDFIGWRTVITAGNSPQFRDAIALGQQIQLLVDKDNPDAVFRNYTVNTSGYSWGQGMAQIQAYTFGWKGVGFDGVGAGAIVSSADFQSLASGMGITPVGKAADFIADGTVWSEPTSR